MVAENESQDEKGDTEEDGNTGDDVDEVLDFLGNWRVARADVGGEGGNAA